MTKIIYLEVTVIFICPGPILDEGGIRMKEKEDHPKKAKSSDWVTPRQREHLKKSIKDYAKTDFGLDEKTATHVATIATK